MPADPTPDSLTRLLEAVRLQSSILSVAELRRPWAVFSNRSATAIFHAVVDGDALLRVEPASADPLRVELRRGDVAILPQGSAHVLCDDESSQPVSVRALERVDHGSFQVVRHGGRGAETRIICGSVRLAREGAEALLSLLPPLVVGSGQTPEGRAMRGAIDMLDHELRSDHPGAETVVVRLSDAVFVAALRHSLARVGSRGWLPAMRDPHIGRALFVLHEDLARSWSALELGAVVGMSRSAFFKRFTELVGEPPAQYIARVRVHVAADLLKRHELSTAEIAERVGYRSIDAFSRLFKKQLGQSPSLYRRTAMGSPTSSPWANRAAG